MDFDRNMIETMIRQIISEQGDDLSKFREVDKSGVISIKANRVKCEPFPFAIESKDVYLKDIISVEESPRLGCGMMELKNGTSFKWKLDYDEIDYIIDGTLDIIIDGRTVSASAGEILFIPKGSSISFSTPDETRFVYIVYPANWAEQ